MDVISYTHTKTNAGLANGCSLKRLTDILQLIQLPLVSINMKNEFINLGFANIFESQIINIWPPSMGPFARYTKSGLPGMPGTLFPPTRFSDPDMHHDTCVTHVPWCMLGSLTGSFIWIRWRGKRSRHSRCMRNPQFYESGERPMSGSPPSFTYIQSDHRNRV